MPNRSSNACGDALGQFLRTRRHEAQAAELFRRAAAQVNLQERRRGQQERHRVFLHQPAHGLRVERIRVVNHADAERRRQRQRAREPERMEERQHAENTVARAERRRPARVARCSSRCCNGSASRPWDRPCCRWRKSPWPDRPDVPALRSRARSARSSKPGPAATTP